MAYVTVALAGVTAIGQLQGGRMANAQAQLAGQQADIQAGQLDYQGKVEREQAMETARLIRRAGAQQIGQSRVAYAGAGAVVGEGSAGEVERQQYIDVEHDAYQALLDGSRRARGYAVESANSRASGQIDRASGLMKQGAGLIAAGGSVLAGGASAMRGAGWRTAGPGFSGQQAPAPVTTLYPTIVRGGE